ncbi:hypothetical protein [Mesorhizobium sp. M8A.F.Ca.ET.165.01.1.1]|nr:hypothetical protein [Mesorhizobium sp. M8A.F.Ca.ET.165.01.1.1]
MTRAVNHYDLESEVRDAVLLFAGRIALEKSEAVLTKWEAVHAAGGGK